MLLISFVDKTGLRMICLHSLLKCVISVELALGEDVKKKKKNNKMRQNNWLVLEKRQLLCPESDVRVKWDFFLSSETFRVVTVEMCAISQRSPPPPTPPHPFPSFTPPLLLSVKQRQAPESALR